MKLTITPWGSVEGQDKPVKLFTISNSTGTQISVTNYGCIVTSIITPDKNGELADVVLGYENLDKYIAGHPFFGAIAGRYANRIKDGRYQLDGELFQLETNEPPTTQHLHGGSKGFDKYVWDYSIEEKDRGIFVHFCRVSPNGESGYGGTVNVVHTVGLDEENQVHYNFKATTDKPTVINLVNHSYYNLAGHDSGSTDGHHLKIYGDFYTPVAQNMIPTGEVRSVKNSGLDFTQLTQISDNKLILTCDGYDHNYLLHKREVENGYALAADLYEPSSGRMMTVLTTQPAVQFYNGFKLSNKPWFGRNGYKYESCGGLCLETQHCPDSPNQVHFPTTRLNPGEIFEEKTIHRFSVK